MYTFDLKNPKCFAVFVTFIVVLNAFAQPTTKLRLVDNGDGTVTDTSTGLMWTKTVSVTQRTFAAAQAIAKSTALGGHKDWRLPSCRELEAMAAIYSDYLDLLNIPSGEYLTQTPNPGYVDAIWLIGIYPKNKPYTGGSNKGEYAKTQAYVVYQNGGKRFAFYLWLVRGNKDPQCPTCYDERERGF